MSSNLPKFMNRIKKELVEPAIAQNVAILIGKVIKSQYTETNSITCDIVIKSSDSNKDKSVISGVPMLHIGGIQQMLPIVGSLVAVGFYDANSSSPFVIGIIPTDSINKKLKDDTSPRVPPKTMAK